MESIADVTIAAATEMPRFEDGFINLQEVLRQLAESVVNEIMSAEADQLCDATGQPTSERQAEWQLVARRAIEASLELADELKAA